MLTNEERYDVYLEKIIPWEMTLSIDRRYLSQHKTLNKVSLKIFNSLLLNTPRPQMDGWSF